MPSGSDEVRITTSMAGIRGSANNGCRTGTYSSGFSIASSPRAFTLPTMPTTWYQLPLPRLNSRRFPTARSSGQYFRASASFTTARRAVGRSPSVNSRPTRRNLHRAK